MIRFECDYAEGAHERILRQLFTRNLEQYPGYGEDEHCVKARSYIRKLCKDDSVDVHFLVGGSQTNATVISSALRPHQGVVAPVSGHISVHETGGIEAFGHKVLTVPTAEGKLSALDVRRVYETHWNDTTHEHMVQPGMVYISLPTENGTMYNKQELQELWEACQDCDLFLFVDGARLGYGLMSDVCDLKLADLARLCDVFYLGGTKQGLLFGEAVVISNDLLKRDFRYLMKQHGAMLAKGWLLGLQFSAMLEDGLYFEVARNADRQAMRLRHAFEKEGYAMLFDSHTNQQFPVLPDAVLEKLEENFSFAFWSKVDGEHTAVRVCTSWATEESDVNALVDAIHFCSEGE